MSQPQIPVDDEALDARIQAMVEARVQAMMKSGAAQLPAAADDETLVDAKQVLGPILGGRSDMWLHRKLKDPNPEKKFPNPDVVLSGRRYWRRGTIRAWIDAQARNGARTRSPTASTAGAGLILLTFFAQAINQFSAACAPVVTLARDPNPSFIAEVVANAEHSWCGATVGGSVGRQMGAA